MNNVLKNILIVCSMLIILVLEILQNVFVAPFIISLTVVGTQIAEVTQLQLSLVWIENILFWLSNIVFLIIFTLFCVFVRKYQNFNEEIRILKLKKFMKYDILLISITLFFIILFRFINDTFFFYIMFTTLCLPIVFLIATIILLKKNETQGII